MYSIGIVLQWIAIIFVFAELLYILIQRPSYYQSMLAMCLVSLLVWAFGYLIELQGLSMGNYDMAVTGTRVGYIGKPFVILAMFLFLARYINIRFPKWLVSLLIILHSWISLAAFTSDKHRMFYSSITYDEVTNTITYGHGPVYHVYLISIIGYFLVNLLFGIKSIIAANNNSEKLRGVIICGMIFTGVAGFLIFLTGITNGYDTTFTGCMCSAFLLFILFWKYRLFDSLTLARERMLDSFHDGFIVVNATGRVEYANDKAAALFPDMWKSDKEASIIRQLEELARKREYYFDDGFVYSVSAESVIDREVYYGKVLNLTDITERYYYTDLLQKEVEEKTSNIRSIQRNVTEGFATLVEARDSVTGDHILNTTNYVRWLSQALIDRKMFSDVLTDEYAEMLILVSPLHDIGKIAVPDSVLNKPGKLTDEEFDIIKTHTSKGGEIIDQIFAQVESDEYVEMARDVVKHHHERWDGNGYPDKLVGEEIPVSAQIMAICDVYDALRSVRPYKKAFTKEKTLDIIAAEKGKQFNEDIVNVFLEISKDFPD